MAAPARGPRRWFRRWLALLPFETRRDYGQDMESVFLAEHRERSRRGRTALGRLWAETIGGLLAFASQEQWSATRDDLRQTVRGWRRSPGLFALLVSTMCAGIAGVAVAFALVDAVLLRPLPVPEPGSLVRLTEAHPDTQLSNITYATFLDLEAGRGSLRHVAASRFWFANLTGEGTPERLAGALVSGHFFDALDVAPALGRLLTIDDDRRGRDDVVVISDSLWRRRFGASAGAIGRPIRLNGRSMGIVGVLPGGVSLPLGLEVWSPLAARESGLETNRRSHLLQVFARLAPGASLDAAQTELDVAAAGINLAHPDVDPDLRLAAGPALSLVVAPVATTLWTILAAALLLLLVLATNVAHVQLARAAGRGREFAVRTALGASRGRIARLVLTESAALSLLAGFAGVLVAWLCVAALPAMLPPDLPRAPDIVFSWRVAAAGLAAASAVGVGFGLWPALSSAGLDRAGGARVRGGPSRTPGSLLAAVQLSVTFALVVVAVLVVRSAAEVSRLPLGFSADGLVRVDLSLSPGRVADRSNGDAYVAVLDPLLRRLEAVPGVTATGLTTTAPFGPGAATSFVVVGRPEPEGREPLADIRIVDPGLFGVLGVPLLAGRGFTRDDRATSRPVMVISETLARRHFDGENPIGRFITMLNWGPPITAEVVGVVGDVIGGELEEPVNPTIYWHYPQFPQLFVISMFVRTGLDEAALVPDVKRAIWEIEPDQPLPRVEPMSYAVRDARARRLTLTWLLAGLAGAAVLFALVGLYGVLAHKVARERPAHGVRVALGARPVDIATLVGREAARVAAIGIAAGAGLAAAAGRGVEDLLFRTGATDVVAFVTAAALVAAAVAAASFVPAWRASRVDPLVVLRSE